MPLSFEHIPTVISYDDGEGDTAGIGVAGWKNGVRSVAGYIAVPDEVRQLWACPASTHGDMRDNFEIEALGLVFLFVELW